MTDKAGDNVTEQHAITLAPLTYLRTTAREVLTGPLRSHIYGRPPGRCYGPVTVTYLRTTAREVLRARYGHIITDDRQGSATGPLRSHIYGRPPGKCYGSVTVTYSRNTKTEALRLVP